MTWSSAYAHAAVWCAAPAFVQDIKKDLKIENLPITTGAVCVYPNRVKEAVKFLEGAPTHALTLDASTPHTPPAAAAASARARTDAYSLRRTKKRPLYGASQCAGCPHGLIDCCGC